MESQEIASVETNHLNGFSTVTESLHLKELSPIGPVVENLESISHEGSSVQSDIPTLLRVFKNVYDQRISSIENNADLDRNRKNEEKVTVLQQYLEQIQDQNDTFVLTMLELETEAQQRVKQMEKRLKSSAKTTMEAVINVHECEKEMRRLVEERLYIESLYNDIQQQLSGFKEENTFLRDQNCNLSHDVQALLHIIHHARSTGHWEMNCVTFCEVTPEQVFGPVQSISNVYTSESPQSDFDALDHDKKILSSDLSSQEVTDSNTSSPYMVHPIKSQLRDENSTLHSHSDDSHNENRVQIYPSDLPSSGTSLPKCISLPDIGNIYSFTNVVRKSHSYCTFGVASVNKLPTKDNVKCVKMQCNDRDASEPQKCKLTNKKSELSPCIRKGQSEPHLFMFGDNIYVYRPCEPIKKASNIALHDDYETSLPPCESIDLKFPTEESRTNVCNWTTLHKSESFVAPQHSYFKDEDSSSSCTCSDPEIESFNKEMYAQLFGNKVSSSVQTEDTVSYSIGLQAAIKRDDESNGLCSCSDPGVNSFDKKIFEELLKTDVSSIEMNTEALNSIDLQADISKIKDKIENGSYKMDIPKIINAMQGLKESLKKAEDKAEAKEILTTQLQGHLTSAVKEVELKDTALQNLEKKLDLSRNECATLKEEISDLNSEIHHVLKELEDMQMLNDNLCLKADAKEEKIQELLNEQKVLQEQKRALLTRLDAQEDELEHTKRDLETARNKADSCYLQVEQQSKIIRNLQEALVQSKRAFDAVHQKTPSLHGMSSESKNSSRSSIVDI